MADGGFQVTITAQSGSYTFVGDDISTEGSVTFVSNDGGFTLTADPGIYAFLFKASNFQFANPALTWADPGANRNLTWMSKDDTYFAVTDINFVTGSQTVGFTINPDNGGHIDGDIARLSLPPIDPTVLNNPMPGGSDPVLESVSLAIQELVMAG